MASHRSNVRDTVLHLEIINPVAGKKPSYLDWDRALYSASSIYGARLSTGIDEISNLRRRAEWVKSVSRLSNGIDSKMEIYKIRYATYDTNVFVY